MSLGKFCFSRRAWPLVAALVAMAVPGCGSGDGAGRLKVHPVEGQVQFEGRPLEGAFIVLHPKGIADAKVLAAHARTDVFGNFKATTYDSGDGAISGEYVVTVQYSPLVQTDAGFLAGPNLLPPKYASPQTTDLLVRIAEGENKLPPINLRR